MHCPQFPQVPSVPSLPALAYYYDHQAETGRSIEEGLAVAEAFRRNNSSPLREKLKVLL